ncbi:hypothetical protein G155_00192 [Mycobacterium sp. VKM Ac-1817D]|nr:hypothetical protein G155_00192 [Mycobacterium sp. VKM Ac-1817D]
MIPRVDSFLSLNAVSAARITLEYQHVYCLFAFVFRLAR